MTGFLILLLTALSFIIAGHYMYRKPPKKINNIYGYRTKRSKSSQEAWDFAQNFSSQWMVKTGYFMGILSTLFLILPDNTPAMVVSVLLTVAGCVIPIYLTEKEIKSKF